MPLSLIIHTHSRFGTRVLGHYAAVVLLFAQLQQLLQYLLGCRALAFDVRNDTIQRLNLVQRLCDEVQRRCISVHIALLEHIRHLQRQDIAVKWDQPDVELPYCSNVSQHVLILENLFADNSEERNIVYVKLAAIGRVLKGVLYLLCNNAHVGQ